MRARGSHLSQILWAVAGAALLLAALAPNAQPQESSERILAFCSDIAVDADGSMLVRETIKVRSAGDQIKRGIYRDFPTRYTGRFGHQYVVAFEVLEVQRDGRPERFHTEDVSNGKRVYIGRKSTSLSPGEYTYTLLYRTTRQLGFFTDHDELYWNVTGNGWIFPIDEAYATVALPRGAGRHVLVLDGYTGPEGSLGTAFKSAVDSEGRITFTTTKALQPAEGLAIVVSWPKGFVAAPTREMKLRYFLEDNRSTVVGLAGFVLLLVYYLVSWLMVGRDPARGIIMPLYEPPPGFSPAAARYLTKMGFDNKAFAAAIINMAVKKYLTISEEDGEFTLTRAKADKTVLSAEEKKIADKLLETAQKIELKTQNHAKVRAAIEALKTSLHLNQEKIYFLTNRRYLIPGLVFSVLVLAFIALAESGERKFTAGFMSVWLTGWSVGVFFLLSQVIRAWREVISGGESRVGPALFALFISLFSFPFLVGEAVGLYVLASVTSITVIVILVAIAFVDYLFHHLLKAPTHAGRRLLDKIEGFRMFLSAVEKDRFQVLYPQRRTPELFEKYLPYALALDVEQEWAEQFSDVLAQAGQRGAGYSPAWYSGTSWSSLGASGFASSLGSSFTSAISSSATAPGSRSGGGGGSSGGGGGGGGGGGW